MHPRKALALWYCELVIDRTYMSAGKIIVGQNFSETNLLSENDAPWMCRPACL